VVFEREGAQTLTVWCGVKVWWIKEEERVFSIPILDAATKVEMVDVNML
jgi:hypothetical protein